MITCPTCGKQTEGVNHNGRGWRCTFCFARIPEPAQPATGVSGSWIPAQQPEQEPEPEPRQYGPEYSPQAKAELKPEPEKGKRR